jgi:Flp pilus assembly protein TadG
MAQAVEFALILPVMMAISSGIVDYGWYFSQDLALIDASRSGVRAGVTADPEVDDYCDLAVDATRDALTLAGLDGTAATVTAATTGSGDDRTLTVTVSLPYGAPFGLVPVPPNLANAATMRIEDGDGADCST